MQVVLLLCGMSALRVIEGLAKDEARFDGSVLSIGNFDGVHRGHQEILGRAREYADREKVPVVVLTFDPHPLAVVPGAKAPSLLSRHHQKMEELERAGADAVVIASATPEFLGIEPRKFIEQIVFEQFHARHVVEGFNFGFGHLRSGNVDTLKQYAEEYGYGAHVVEPVTELLPDGSQARVSSSLIRELLAEGEVELAARALGRPYVLEGTVITGVGRGHPLGFPTANLGEIEQLIPGDGVYDGTARINGEEHIAAISIGRTPTFKEHELRIEAHLLDYEGDLYTREMGIRFLRRLRGQVKFESQEQLVHQIEEDIKSIREAHKR